MDKKGLLSLLNKMIEQEGSQKLVARKLHISQQYLNDILRDRREPGESILKPLGLKRIVTYDRR